MLVLSRKEGQTIVIGDGIEIHVAAIQGNRVRIAVNAPRSTRVLRGEIAGEARLAPQRSDETERTIAEPVRHCV
ncbi:MAG: carbon storage regulator [Planctomycetaceae bacterium]